MKIVHSENYQSTKTGKIYTLRDVKLNRAEKQRIDRILFENEQEDNLSRELCVQQNSNKSLEYEEDDSCINNCKPFWEEILKISSEIPLEEWEKVPKDRALNYKHYLYGHPKVSE